MSSSSVLERLNDNPIARPFVALGNGAINSLTELGLVIQFFASAVLMAFRPPFRVNLLLNQMEFVGVGSLFIIMLTGTFTGAVFTLQTVNGLAQFNLESVVGTTVMIGVTRELAPVLTALMVTGRVASAMATELGTMRVTEQIDAMEVMAVNPVQYLASPRILASAIMVPCLSMLFVSVAYAGAYIMAVPVLGIDEGAYISRIQEYVAAYDVMHGFYKSIILGILLATVGCYKGYHAAGGARGVGNATTQAVVISSISVFVLDYVLSALLMKFEPTYNAVSY